MPGYASINNNRQSALLIGNGFNRLIDNPRMKEDFRWDSLLSEISKVLQIDSYRGVSAPLQFDDLIIRALSDRPDIKLKAKNVPLSDEMKFLYSGNDLEDRLLKYVAHYFRNRDYSEPHYLLKSLLSPANIGLFDLILTTNYDLQIEKAMLSYLELAGNTITYQNYKSRSCGAISFKIPQKHSFMEILHIHGVDLDPSSICLGYDHYISNVSEFHNFYSGESNEEELINAVSNGSELRLWTDALFTMDVAIVGLGLNFEEIDLWWLLSIRGKFFAKYRDLPKNRITYYQIAVGIDGCSDIDTLRKTVALDNMGVKVRTIAAPNYELGYERLIKIICNDCF